MANAVSGNKLYCSRSGYKDTNLICLFCSYHWLMFVSVYFLKDKRDAVLEEAKSLIDAQEDPK